MDKTLKPRLYGQPVVLARATKSYAAMEPYLKGTASCMWMNVTDRQWIPADCVHPLGFYPSCQMPEYVKLAIAHAWVTHVNSSNAAIGQDYRIKLEG